MVLPLIGGLVGAGASILGGLFSSNATRENNAANIAAQQQINQQNIALARETNAQAAADKERDRQLQYEFAQSGIRWKAEDARAAGIHPLYAMGANTVSYAPSSVGLVTPTLAAARTEADTSMGRAFGQAGQDISRAIHSTRTENERLAAVSSTSTALQLQNMGLQNELLRSQIAKINASINPPMPSVNDPYKMEGQTQSGIKLKALEVSPSGVDPHAEGGAIVDTGFARTAGGNYAVVPSKDVKERIEDMGIPELMWAIRNNLGPVLSNQYFKPPFKAPSGKEWSFNPVAGEYVLVPNAFSRRFHY